MTDAYRVSIQSPQERVWIVNPDGAEAAMRPVAETSRLIRLPRRTEIRDESGRVGQPCDSD
jgi:hypothetical protein